MVPHAFNPVDDPCLDVLICSSARPADLDRLLPGTRPGEVREVGLRSALRAAHLIGDLVVSNPAVESALRRFLTALFVRVAGLDVAEVEDWQDRHDALLAAGAFSSQEVDAYFDRWHSRFSLFDPERPLLQDPRLAAECSTQAAPGRLVMTQAAGSNQPWFDHTPQSAPIESMYALGELLAWRCYGPSGTGAQRKHGGVDSKSMKAAPMRSLVSFHPLAETLFASLLLSCPPPDSTVNPVLDLAPWERDELPDPLVPARVHGPVSLLTARATHHVLLAPSEDASQVIGCWVAWGSTKDLPAARDPFVIDRDKGGPVWANYRRALVRDFDAFIHAKDPSAAGLKGVVLPAWLGVYADLTPDQLDGLGPVRVRALGCHQAKMARESHWYAATTPASLAPFLPARDPARAAKVAATRIAAERVEAALAAALRSAWKAMWPGDKNCAWADEARASYWDQAEPLFWQAITVPGGAVPGFERLALTVFDATTRPVAFTADGLHPVARARASLSHPRPTKSPRKAAA
ncbi:type I-E CRISPR-associated protein Cse1/CasA [Streptacidiphilus sp. N1-10]|uniref:Type I-E CRISPR-associated protein Cse1/CasA n=1 Tax=Streptacidiphilus jeojiensis TaxID=3229225 RepID=A0ABV6XXY7_9ACTN